MNRFVRGLLLLVVFPAQHLLAAGTVHVGDGDCAGLAAAANAAPGQEPALIVLARGGSYYSCPIDVSGKIVIDAAGAAWTPTPNSYAGAPSPNLIKVEAGASLTLRNALIGPPPSAPAAAAAKPGGKRPKFCCRTIPPAVANEGSLTLDAVAIANNSYVGDLETIPFGLMINSGSLILRNVSVVGNSQAGNAPALLSTSGPVEISHATIVTTPQAGATALLEAHGGGVISIANSIVLDDGAVNNGACVRNGGSIVSRGGNVFGDASCGATAANDRVAADVRALDFGLHGGVVGTLALDYDSPALNNGLAANCEAADARGLARSTAACDAGALEIGGGNGKLSASGMTGLYYNAANNGHYVTVQRLYGDNALVIWNTFDAHGVPAWLYGVGTVANGHIHVAQVAQNVGGTLHAGGNVSGATPTLWGTFDFDLGDCYHAALSYASPLTAFGSGSTPLQRLAFVQGLDCQL